MKSSNRSNCSNRFNYSNPSNRPAFSILFVLPIFLIFVFSCASFAEDRVVLRIPTGENNPRNSEGASVLLKDGSVLHIYTHYYGTKGGDHDSAFLASRVSHDCGKSWSEKDVTVLENEGKMNIMSVSLLRLNDGRLGMWYLVKDAPTDCRPYMRTSSDEGKTWSERRVCIQEISYNVVNNDRVAQLEDGRLLIPCARHSLQGENGFTHDWNAHLFCMISDDAGNTWRKTAEVAPTRGVVYQEPGVCELADGRLLMTIRTNAGTQFFSYSSDRGETWSVPAASCLASPLSPARIERLPGSENLLAVWNPLLDENSTEFNLNHRLAVTLAVLSPDGSRILAERCIEEPVSDGRNFQYPNFLFLPDGSLLLGYFTFGKNQTFFTGTILKIIESPAKTCNP